MGQKLAAHDMQGNITAFYDSIDSPPPKGVQVLEISDQQWQDALAAPGYTVANGVLTPPAPPSAAQMLAQAQERAWNAIKAERDRLSDIGGYKVLVNAVEKWFHSDPKSKTQQLALARKADKVQAAGGDMVAQFAGNAGQWKTMDGSFVAMTPALAQAIVDAAELQDGAIFAAAEQHRASMEASADPAAYDFSLGWPPVFGG